MSDEEEYEAVSDFDDDDALLTPVQLLTTRSNPESEQLQALQEQYNPSTAAARRVLSDLNAMRGLKPEQLGFKAEPVGKDLCRWVIHLFGFDPKSAMYQDLQRYKTQTGRDYVELRLIIPPNYPDIPPFVGVVQPRLVEGTGHVINGAFCADGLTLQAWKPYTDLVSLITYILELMQKTEPRIDFKKTTPYSVEDVKNAYDRICHIHGWKNPSWSVS
jgi:ubiquitin-conjugating enzyme E2 Q